MGGGDSSFVGFRQSHPEAGLRLREKNCPKSATSPFPAVIAQDSLPPKRPVSLPQGAGEEGTNGRRGPRRPPVSLLSASFPLGAPIPGPALGLAHYPSEQPPNSPPCPPPQPQGPFSSILLGSETCALYLSRSSRVSKAQIPPRPSSPPRGLKSQTQGLAHKACTPPTSPPLLTSQPLCMQPSPRPRPCVAGQAGGSTSSPLGHHLRRPSSLLHTYFHHHAFVPPGSASQRGPPEGRGA